MIKNFIVELEAEIFNRGDFIQVSQNILALMPEVSKCLLFKIAQTQFKVVVGPKRSTNRNLKEIITIECTKTVIFQLLRPLDTSKLATRELIQ